MFQRKNNRSLSFWIIKVIRDSSQLLKSSGIFIIALLITKKSSIREYYLVGSRYGELRSDNAQALFDYLLEDGKEVYFIENNRSDLAQSLKRGSLKSFRLYLNATACFYSHGFSDILPNMHKFAFLINSVRHPMRIFLQHGVIGFKGGDYMSEYLHALDKTMEYIIASTTFEKAIINDLGTAIDKIMITGIPRHDNLITSTTSKEVLIFPTHSEPSLYQKKVSDIFNCVGIIQLKDAGYEITAGVHDMMLEDVEIPEFVAPIQRTVASHVNSSSLLITDNSSIAWDFIYEKSAVIFYQPNYEVWHIQDEFLKSRIANTPEELTEKIEEFIAGKALVDTNYFSFYDGKNCERIMNLVSN